MNIIQKWKSKSFWSKFSDIVFILFLLMMLLPVPRKYIMASVNRLKAMVIQPKLSKRILGTLENQDYEWEIMSMDGKIYHLSDFRGKIVFVNFWATWCGPCLGELPEIEKLYDNFKGIDSFKVLLVSTEKISVIKDFLKRKGYDFPVYKAMSNIPRALYSNSIPASFLIDKRGNIVMREIGATHWGGEKMRQEVEKMLKE
jgi:thiol-disulfide isomerase/thioredoxin